MNKLYSSFHTIDRINQKVEAPQQDNLNDLDDFVNTMTDHVLRKRNNRQYIFASDHSEIHNLLIEAIKENSDSKYDENTFFIAKRLLRSETLAQEKYKHFTEIKKGSLIQSFLSDEDYIYYLCVKIEHNAFINEIDLKKYKGLPLENGLLKTCYITYKKENDTIEKILVSDTSAKISEFWWKDFLELIEKKSDGHNTRESLNLIEKELKKYRKSSPADYFLVRNNTIGYFKTHTEFSMDEFVEQVIGCYEPVNPKIFNIDLLKEALLKLPECSDFDYRFTIDPSAIKKKMTRIEVNVDPNIDLIFKDYVDKLKDKVRSYTDNEGNMFIRIKTNNKDVFDQFHHGGE